MYLHDWRLGRAVQSTPVGPKRSRKTPSTDLHRFQNWAPYPAPTPPGGAWRLLLERVPICRQRLMDQNAREPGKPGRDAVRSEPVMSLSIAVRLGQWAKTARSGRKTSARAGNSNDANARSGQTEIFGRSECAQNQSLPARDARPAVKRPDRSEGTPWIDANF